MKKILFCAALAMAMGSAIAVPISAELTAEGKNSETEGYPERYVAYLCSAAAAETYFAGNTTVDDVTNWLKDNYATGIDALVGGDTAMNPYGEGLRSFDDGEYSFTKYFQDGLAGDYLAVLTYAEDGENWFRVFGNTAEGDGTLTIDPNGGFGEAGKEWTQAVPEPTSGLLLLLGVAGLALKRRRA